jgi:hypothetical protein
LKAPNELVRPRSLLPVHATESRDADFHFDARLSTLVPSTGFGLLSRAKDGADDLGVSHLEIAAAICGVLG